MAVRAVLLAFSLLFVGSNSAKSQETPLSYFPPNTAFIARWHAPKQTQDQLLDTVESLDVGWSVMLESLLEDIGIYISNQELAGVDENGDWWMAVTLDKNLERDVIFAIPASDMSAMKSGLYAENHFIPQGKWGIYTESEPVFEQIESAIKSGTGLGGSLPRDVFSRHHAPGLQVVARLDYLRELFPEVLMLFRTAMQDRMLAGIDDSLRPPGISDLNWKLQKELELEKSRVALDEVFHFLDDITHFGVAVNVTKEDLQLVQSFQFVPGSPTTKNFPTTGDCLAPLARHPDADAYSCVFSNGLISSLRQTVNVHQSEVLKASQTMKIDSTAINKAEALIKDLQLSKMKSTSWSMSVTPDSADGMLNCAIAIHAENTSQLESGIKKLYELFEIDSRLNLISGKVGFQESSLGGQKVSRVEYQLPELALQPSGRMEVPQLKTFGQMLIGKDPTFIQYATLNDSVVGVFGRKDSLLKAMTMPSIAGTKEALKTIKVRNSAFLLAVDVAAMFQNITIAIEEAEKAKSAIDGLPRNPSIPWNKVDLPKSYVTLDMTTQTSSADVTLTIPVQTLENGQKLMPQLLPLFIRNSMSAQSALGR